LLRQITVAASDKCDSVASNEHHLSNDHYLMCKLEASMIQLQPFGTPRQHVPKMQFSIFDKLLVDLIRATN